MWNWILAQRENSGAESVDMLTNVGHAVEHCPSGPILAALERRTSA